MPCAQVVRLGLDKFADVYGDKTQDFSTYGQKQAFSYYVDCKRPANDRLAAALSPAARKQVNDVRESLQAIGNAAWANAYTTAGGGTIYALASVGAYAVREDFMTSLIAAMRNPKAQPAARRRAKAALQKARRLLPSQSDVPTLEHWEPGDREAQQKLFKENVIEMTNAFANIERIVPMLPDRAAELLARRAADELDAGVEE